MPEGCMVPYPADSCFTRDLLDANALDPSRFKAWALASGMGLGELESWWGSLQPRVTPHEGVDLCCYFSSDGDLHLLPRGAQIPAIFDGVVAKLLPDFLGTSIFMEQEAGNGRLLTIFGHVLPRWGLRVGDRLQAGECFCSMAPRKSSGTAPHAHLHLSLAWSDGLVDYDSLNWSNLRNQLQLLDPLSVLGARCDFLGLDDLRAAD
jgi:hypothetical protein